MVRLVCVLLGYVFGLFQTSYILGRLHGIDIREYGSGNAGTTNMLRTMGTKAGLITFAGDCLKCMLAVALVRLLFRNSYGYMLPLLGIYTSAGVILGHNYPFYLGFRGGKGIAATAGMVFSLHPVATIGGLIIFFGIFFATHYVSLGSVMVYVGLMIILPIMGRLGCFHMEQRYLTEMYLVMLFLALLAFWKHRENIKRLMKGTERKTYLSKKNQHE